MQILRGPKDEAEAMHMAMTGTRSQRIQLAIRAGLALAVNPHDTQQVFYLATAVDRRKLPVLAARLEADEGGQALLSERAAIDTEHVDFAALKALPEETLGGAYARALESQGLSPDLFKRPPGLPENLAYTEQRVRQTHDLWHVLTGMSTDIPGEVGLQAFIHAQLQQNFSKFIVWFGLAFYGLRFPQMWKLVKNGRRAGEQAAFLLGVRWEDWWTTPLSEVRAKFNVSVIPEMD
ncbi:MAG: Coq4 family protein [Polyangiales bacterium]